MELETENYRDSTTGCSLNRLNLTGPLVKCDEKERGDVLERVEDGGGGRHTGSEDEKAQSGKYEGPKARDCVPSADAHLRIGGKDDVTDGVEEATDEGGGVTHALVYR